MAFRLSALAEATDGRVEGDPDRSIESINTLDIAGPGDLSFVTNPRYLRQVAESRAGALLVGKVLEGVEKDFLVVDEPYYALAQLLALMYPPTRPKPGIHETALIEEGAQIDSTATVGPYTIVETGAIIESGVHLHGHVVVGRHCRIGVDSVIYPRVVLYAGSVLGERCVLHAGVVVGSDGFGYALHDDTHVKLQHVGRVILEEEVEVGANTTIDRALLGETRIGSGSKIDNLVQVAHNVRLGTRCLLISQSGIAGSSELGKGVVLAGQAGVAGHLELGDGVQVAAKSAVFKSVEPGRMVAGIPAGDAGAWRRQQVLIRRLGEMKRRLEKLEAMVAKTTRREANSDE